MKVIAAITILLLLIPLFPAASRQYAIKPQYRVKIISPDYEPDKVAGRAGFITIEITNLKSNRGFVLVSLFDKAVPFPKDPEKAVGKEKVAISDKKAVVTFENLPPGRYAAAILHDENNNLKMDVNLFGMPKEGYGFSNNARGIFGPPSFDKAAFELKEGGKKLSINATYFFR